MNRRAFLRSSMVAGSGLIAACNTLLASPGFPAIIHSDQMRPAIPYGAQSGDITSDRAIIWSRSDRPARMIVEYATNESFRDALRVSGPAAIEPSDLTARVELTNLPAGEQIFYRVTFQDLADLKTTSVPVAGRFRTAPVARREVRFAWGGDTAGQGWGINREWGGMKIYDALRRADPDFFIHSGDMIYADGPIQSEVKLADGRIWKNLVTPEKSKVAETIDEFRGNYRYNLMDEPLRRFNAAVPQLVQWDDHEVRNNWFPDQRLEDPRYTVKSCALLAARARRAFIDYTPVRLDPLDPERIYRAFKYGPSLEVLLLDERSYRGPNTTNRQQAMSDETKMFGSAQLNWIKSRLAASRATWKVIASDLPVGLVVADGSNFEAFANGDGPALGREIELAELLRFIKRRRIKNVVWVTADVHYAAAHYYDPSRARFTEFLPFWEFVAGPLHAGTFGPAVLDNTFGPEVKFNSVEPGGKQNRPPSDGFQFFGAVKIDRSEAMTVALNDLTGRTLYSVRLSPER
jgi:alkaline phosphatase D